MTPHTSLSALDPHSPVRLFPDDEFRIVNATDASKQLAFDLSAIATGTTRTVTMPDASGTMALLERAQTFTKLATFALGLTVAGAAFASRGIQDDATAKVLDVSNGGTQWVTVKGDTANGPRISVGGAANANLYLSAGAGTGSLYLYTNNIGTCGLRVDHVAGGNQFVTLASGNGTNPTIGASGGTIALSAGAVSTSATNGLGYGTGAGGAVTQATSKGTAVTLNALCGQITMNNAALAAGATVGFTFTNSRIGATDNVHVNITGASVASAGNYNVWTGVQAGSATVWVKNISAGSLSEAVVVTFSVKKGVTS